MSALPPPPPLRPVPLEEQERHFCYRHPDRETGRRCTRCGRWACSDCLVPAAVGSQCLECLRESRPAAAVRVKRWNATQGALVTNVLIAINVAVFVYLGLQDPAAFSGAHITQGQVDLGLARVLIHHGELYRMVTAGFIHFGIIHIAFNMIALWSLGLMLEPAVGRIEYALVYFASLLAGSAGALIIGGAGLTGGASGAVFGLFGAAAMALRARGINPLRTSIGTVLLLNLVLTFSISGISIGGHLGGLAGGTICGAVVGAPHWKRPPRWLVYATPVAVGAISVVAGVLVSR